MVWKARLCTAATGFHLCVCYRSCTSPLLSGLAAAQQAQVEQEEAWAARAQQMKLERRRGRKEAEVAMEEMMPRATGREARVEARIARRVEKREREASPELMKDKDLLGGGDDFQAR